MRLLEIAAVVVFVGGSVALARAAWQRAVAGGRPTEGTWEPYHRFEDGARRVYVRRGAELEPVGEVVPSNPDYDAIFLTLMDRARERAAVLNSELGAGAR
ncbi:MAG TPA: hypothetical protein VF257_04650 [Solirubrobacteraceae bacterium]